MEGLTDSVAVVTGGGIGGATARRLAAKGASVVVADVDRAAAEEPVSAIRSDGGDATFGETDVTDPDAARAMVETAIEEYGGLDVAVNNAGIITSMVDVAEIEDEQWDACSTAM